jgi:hypothetical protein
VAEIIDYGNSLFGIYSHNSPSPRQTLDLKGKWVVEKPSSILG